MDFKFTIQRTCRLLAAVVIGCTLTTAALLAATSASSTTARAAASPLEPPPSCGSHIQVSRVTKGSDYITVRVVAVDMAAVMPSTYGLIFIDDGSVTKGGYNVSRNSGANFKVTFDTRATSISGNVDVTNVANTTTWCTKRYTA